MFYGNLKDFVTRYRSWKGNTILSNFGLLRGQAQYAPDAKMSPQLNTPNPFLGGKGNFYFLVLSPCNYEDTQDRSFLKVCARSAYEGSLFGFWGARAHFESVCARTREKFLLALSSVSPTSNT